MIAGIDVNENNIVIAFKKNEKVKFIRIRRIEDRITIYSILQKLIENKIFEVKIEDPEIIKKDLKDEKSINTILFLEKLKETLEFAKIKVITVNPRKTSRICPICNEELSYKGIVDHYVYCPKCDIAINRDEIASWNILKRKEIKVVA